jgi:hypothetical protein
LKTIDSIKLTLKTLFFTSRKSSCIGQGSERTKEVNITSYLKVQSLTASALGFAVFLPGPAREKRAPAPGKPIILGPLKRHSSNSFGPGQGRRIILRERVQLRIIFGEVLSRLENLSEFRRQYCMELNIMCGTSFNRWG